MSCESLVSIYALYVIKQKWFLNMNQNENFNNSVIYNILTAMQKIIILYFLNSF